MSLRTPTTRTRVGALGVAVALALSLTACGDDSSSGDSTDVTVEDNPDFPADSTMAALADEGKITIGVKIDQPGIGNLEPGADAPEGLDIEMGRIIAAGLGISDDNIDWKETISDNREAFIKGGDVDLVIASYSITDDRREMVGQAGPYYVTGQQILVREEDKDKITGPDDLYGHQDLLGRGLDVTRRPRRTSTAPTRSRSPPTPSAWTSSRTTRSTR